MQSLVEVDKILAKLAVTVFYKMADALFGYHALSSFFYAKTRQTLTAYNSSRILWKAMKFTGMIAWGKGLLAKLLVSLRTRISVSKLDSKTVKVLTTYLLIEKTI